MTDTQKPFYVYFIRAKTRPSTVKIGKAEDPQQRLRELQVGCPHRLWIEGKIRCYSAAQAFELERELQRLFDSHRVRGEWFWYGGMLQKTVMIACRGQPSEKRDLFAKVFRNYAKSVAGNQEKSVADH